MKRNIVLATALLAGGLGAGSLRAHGALHRGVLDQRLGLGGQRSTRSPGRPAVRTASFASTEFSYLGFTNPFGGGPVIFRAHDSDNASGDAFVGNWSVGQASR